MGKRILVVDDDPMIRALVESMLQAEGHEVVLAEDGKQGVEILDNEPRPVNFDVIILDVVMPGMNGLDVATRLKLHPHTQSIPILMLTGEDKAEDIMSGYSVGADYYITKPFTRQQLLFGLNLVLEGEGDS
ncbi:MAG: response regulator [Candidatus Dadabacteria bacterium]|nr:MAG: response regulator [Candidatus Dadabacteria bacterium]